MSWKKIAIGLFSALCLLAFLLYLFQPRSQIDWPDFPQSQEPTPVVVVKVEPDFGYRTGDIVPISIFIQEPAGSKVDLGSLAIIGNFEIRGEAKITSKNLPEGGHIYCLQMELQSFVVSRKLSTSMSLIWDRDNDPVSKEIQQPLLEVYTSYTWDGRKEIKDGPLNIAGTRHWLVSISLICLSIAGLAGSILALAQAEKARQKQAVKAYNSAQMVCKRKVDAAWAKIASDDLSEANFREIDAALREYLNLSSVVLKHLPNAIGDSHPYQKPIMRTIISCEKVIFSKSQLDRTELRQMQLDLDAVLMNRFSFLDELDPGYELPQN